MHIGIVPTIYWGVICAWVGSQIRPNQEDRDNNPISARMGSVELLYTSHFLSAWNSRAFQFGSVLFIATLYPGTLLPVSIYALASVLPGALLAHRFGVYIDTHGRLSVVRWSIIGQRVAVVLACLLFLFPVNNQAVVLLLLALLGGTENSWNIINTVSVERDWVVVVAGNDRDLLSRLNARMRFIDLACKLLGPAAIGFIDSVDHSAAIVAVLGMSALSCGVEYFAIARVYRAVPELAIKNGPEDFENVIREAESERAEGRDDEPVIDERRRLVPPSSTPSSSTASSPGPAFSFWRHPLMPVSLGNAFTYITVLAFSGQLIAYLMASGMPVKTITLFRTGSVVIELSATLAAPIAVRYFGPLKSAAAFIDFQWLVLLVTAVLFACYSNPVAGVILSVGVSISRIGLWGFDLSTQIIVQDGVSESERGRYSTYEKSLQNWGMIILFTITIIFHDPRLFVYPVMVSVTTVGMTMVAFNYFLCTYRRSD